MKRLLYRLLFFLRSALRGLRASLVTSAVAVATIAATLLLAGIFVLVVGNMEDLLERFSEDILVVVWLEDGLDEAAQQELAQTAGTIEGVEAVVLVSKQEALARFEAGVGARLGLTEALDENPLPASLELRLAPESRTSDRISISSRRA